MSSVPTGAGNLAWRVSPTCESGACVMVARDGDSVLVANSGRPDGPVNVFTRAEWREFLAGAKLGKFDDIA